MAVVIEPVPAARATLDFSKPAQEIRTLAGQSKGLMVSHHQADVRFQILPEAEARSIDEHRVCVFVERLVIRIGLQNRTTFVARELLDYPCILLAASDHGQRQAALDDELLGRFAYELSTVLAQEYEGGLVAQARRLEEAKSMINERLRIRLSSATETFRIRRRRAQDAIDNAQASALASDCSAEMWSFLNRVK